MTHRPTQPQTCPFKDVNSQIDLPQNEEEILRFWDENKIFEKSLSPNSQKKFFSFYDGPPFATGLPHYGHILAGVLKDIVPRFWTMKGFLVPRRFGWDCHGLPVEHEINKAQKIESNKQILAMGIDHYNQACRSIVNRYSQEWKKTVRRMGRWVDMDSAYYTMDVNFMQSVWWVFRELWDRGLIYEGHKVLPYSTGLSTPLSNFEANQNYKQVQDPAITISFPLEGEVHTSLLAWTTTPWTLPSNLALAVGKDIDYIQVTEKDTNHNYIVAAALAETVFKSVELKQPPHSVSPFKGSKLLGQTYEPLFDFFSRMKDQGAFRIIHSDHVTTTSGTGIVHMAPAFGEDDYYACLREKIPVVNPVDDDGMFTPEVPPFSGKRVKEADKDIIAELKNKKRLFRHETITHSYPYCWRTETPLIYRAVSSWFVAVEKIKDRLSQANLTTRWVPDMLRDGRFGNWLENARDWAVSRNRFWGTPIPIWRNAEGDTICVGSKSELECLSGQSLHDLHIDVIDKIFIPAEKISPKTPSSSKGTSHNGPLKRVSGVLDCWFESGSMPYAQWGYPHQNCELFQKTFPADFIAEGLDQTRGWFYTLMVIGTALFDKAPFRNVVVNGMVLAEDGKKMSKSLRNYPDPMDVLNRHGADALRLYLIDSPVVKAQEIRFSESAVSDVVRKILLRWWNSYSFFVNYANIDRFYPRGDSENSPNLLDQWILSRLHFLIENTEKEMGEYRLYNVVPGLLQFIEDLTNTYIRFNRPHFWAEEMPEDKRFAYETLYEVLITFSKIMAPFAPFLSETIYLNLKSVHPRGQSESIHLELFPIALSHLKRPELEAAVEVMNALVLLGRNFREKVQIKAKIPLKTMRIIHRSSKTLEDLKNFEPYFRGELNVLHIEYDNHEDHFIQISAKANYPTLGPKLGQKMKKVASAIASLSLAEILRLEKGEVLVIENENISIYDVEIRRSPRIENPNLCVDQKVSLEFDSTLSESQILMGLARELIRKIQAARKNARFLLDDRISLEIACSPPFDNAILQHRELIKKETLAVELKFMGNPRSSTDLSPKGSHIESLELDGSLVILGLTSLPRS